MVLRFVENYEVRAAEVLTSGGVEDSNENFVQLVNSVPTLALYSRPRCATQRFATASANGGGTRTNGGFGMAVYRNTVRPLSS